jgi:hypothetical protein
MEANDGASSLDTERGGQARGVQPCVPLAAASNKKERRQQAG